MGLASTEGLGAAGGPTLSQRESSGWNLRNAAAGGKLPHPIIGGASMASLFAQKEGLREVLEQAHAAFRELADRSSGKAGEELRGLYGGWVLENLDQSAAIVRAIDVEKVKALREERQTTAPVFESKIDAAVKRLKDTHGVKYSIAELFKNKASFSAEEIRGLGRVLRLTERALRRFTIFRSRSWSLLTNGWLWIGLLVIALVSIPAYRYGVVYFQSSTTAHASVAPKDAVLKQVEADATLLQTRAREPEKSFLSRTAAVAKDIWTLMDTIPKIFTALSGFWGILLLWMRR